MKQSKGHKDRNFIPAHVHTRTHGTHTYTHSQAQIFLQDAPKGHALKRFVCMRVYVWVVAAIRKARERNWLETCVSVWENESGEARHREPVSEECSECRWRTLVRHCVRECVFVCVRVHCLIVYFRCFCDSLPHYPINSARLCFVPSIFKFQTRISASQSIAIFKSFYRVAN